MHRARSVLRQVAVMLLLALAAAGARAHEVRPALAEISFPDGRWQIAFIVNLEQLIAGIGPEHEDTSDSPMAATYDEFRAMPPDALKEEFAGFQPRFLSGVHVAFDGVEAAPELVALTVPAVGDLDMPRDSFVTVGGPLPEGAETVSFSWDRSFGTIVFRTEYNEAGEGFSAYLQPGSLSEPIPVIGASTSALDAFGQYLIVGFEHILPLGLDHILFVIGLFLLSTRLRPLLIQITCFTAAHTVTLALGALGVVNIPGSIVEPLIALTITYVAIENVFSEKLQTWRPFLVFGFGLLHGLGFAGVLSEFGFAPGQFVASLVAFNLGVEFGQLTVIAACFLAVGFWFGQKSWYRPFVVYPASMAIAGYSFTWFLERSLGFETSIAVPVAATLVIGAGLLAIEGWWARLGPAAAVLACAAPLTVCLRLIEGLIP